jgi:hypothetical protein
VIYLDSEFVSLLCLNFSHHTLIICSRFLVYDGLRPLIDITYPLPLRLVYIPYLSSAHDHDVPYFEPLEHSLWIRGAVAIILSLPSVPVSSGHGCLQKIDQTLIGMALDISTLPCRRISRLVFEGLLTPFKHLDKCSRGVKIPGSCSTKPPRGVETR